MAPKPMREVSADWTLVGVRLTCCLPAVSLVSGGRKSSLLSPPRTHSWELPRKLGAAPICQEAHLWAGGTRNQSQNQEQSPPRCGANPMLTCAPRELETLLWKMTRWDDNATKIRVRLPPIIFFEVTFTQPGWASLGSFTRNEDGSLPEWGHQCGQY